MNVGEMKARDLRNNQTNEKLLVSLISGEVSIIRAYLPFTNHSGQRQRQGRRKICSRKAFPRARPTLVRVWVVFEDQKDKENLIQLIRHSSIAPVIRKINVD
jgi:hypothetical protein